MGWIKLMTMEDISYVLIITSNYLFEIKEEIENNNIKSALLQEQITKVTSALARENDVESLERMIEENKVLIQSSRELIDRQRNLIDKYRFWYDFLCKMNLLVNENTDISLEALQEELQKILSYYEEKEEFEKCIFIKEKLDSIKLRLKGKKD